MFKTHPKKFYFTIVLILAIMSLVSFFYYTNTANASATDNVSGFAWSDNIGWISFNSTDVGSAVPYGVDIDIDTGNFSGYAWSDNIGWITFNAGELTNCPSGSCAPTADWTTGEITGWARACAGAVPADCSNSATSRADGWDGWISLSGVATDGSPYGAMVSTVTGDFSGFAWGGTVTGWVSMSGSAPAYGVRIDAPSSATISGNGCTILEGDSGCFGELSWNIIFPEGPTSVYNETASTFISSAASAGPPPVSILLPYRVNLIEARDDTGVLDFVTLLADCNTAVNFWDSSKCGQIPTIDIGFDASLANSKIVRTGETADVDMDITSDYDLTCDLYGANVVPDTVLYEFASGNISVNGTVTDSYTTRPLFSKQIISLLCEVEENGDGNPEFTVSDEITIEVIGAVQEI
jgi:hypothetical protein